MEQNITTAEKLALYIGNWLDVKITQPHGMNVLKGMIQGLIDHVVNEREEYWKRRFEHKQKVHDTMLDLAHQAFEDDRQEIMRLREVLSFYADNANYLKDVMGDNDIQVDHGQKAREALNLTKER